MKREEIKQKISKVLINMYTGTRYRTMKKICIDFGLNYYITKKYLKKYCDMKKVLNPKNGYYEIKPKLNKKGREICREAFKTKDFILNRL